jgi:hypothetical protein
MKKLLSLTLATLLCVTTFASAEKQHKYPTSTKTPVHDGLWWQNKSSTFKEGFIGGYKLGTERAAGHPADVNKYPSSELLTGLDTFWSDFRNRSILFDDAVTYVEDQLRGVPDDKLTAELLKMRAAAAPSGDQ